MFPNLETIHDNDDVCRICKNIFVQADHKRQPNAYDVYDGVYDVCIYKNLMGGKETFCAEIIF